jgi:hypothetical protein
MLYWISIAKADLSPSPDEALFMGAAILFPLILLIIFPLFWCGVVYLMSRMGWNKLAEHHQTDLERPNNAVLTSGTLRSIINYSGMLYLGSTEDGIHLSVMKLFSVGHPSLFVPWDSIQDLGTFSMLLRYRSIQVEGVKIWFREKVWQEITRHRNSN